MIQYWDTLLSHYTYKIMQIDVHDWTHEVCDIVSRKGNTLKGKISCPMYSI